MNEKLKGILRTAWNEPRHFFFWLAMLSICGFIAALGGAAMIGPATLLAFVALGCILCFVVSTPAFILAWIPPVRRLFSSLLRRRFLVLGCLVTLVALFYAIEDWRGRHAWQSYKRAWEAKGERFDWASLAPPPVPDDQNFFASPLWEDLRSETVPVGVTGESRIVLSAYGPNEQFSPSLGNWAREQRVNLAAWQGFYRGSTNELVAAERAARLAGLAAMERRSREAFLKRYYLDTAPPFPPTNYFPVAKEAQAPAADVLLALSRFETNRQRLVASATRPYARFWINYDAGLALMVPHLARIKASSQYLSLHATAALKAGDRETALEDIKLLFRLIEAIRGEPILISQLVRIAVVHIALQPVWEGLADRQWTESEVSAIESELGKLDFLADYRFAMRGERACNLWWVDSIRKAGISGLNDMSASRDDSGPFEVEQFLGWATFHLIPAGWFDQNKLSLCRLYEKYLLPLVGDSDQRVVSPAAIQKANSALERQRWRPYDVFSRLLLPALARFAEKCALGQTSVDLARVACALERYRLANDQFPDTLNALAPKFIAKLPHDLINGQPLKYRRTDDGQFVLYSVGLNETDDGGTVGFTKNDNLDPNKGDWVWRYPAK